MAKRILAFILNQYILSGIIALCIIYFLPDYFQKHNVELESQEHMTNSQLYFEDLNADGISEKIVYYENGYDQPAYMIFTHSNVLIDQYNFQSRFTNEAHKNLWFHDIDSNGLKEIYNITLRKDSVYLNIFEPFAEEGISKRDIFVDTLLEYNGGFSVDEGNASRIYDRDGKKLLLFTLGAGFGGNPRNAYTYSISDDEIVKSVHLVNKSIVHDLADINNDGYDEILLRNASADNTIDSIYTTRSDASSWLNVLDKDLNFLFPPKEFKVRFSGLTNFFIEKDNEVVILSVLVAKNNPEVQSQINFFSNKGELLFKKELPSGFYRCLLNRSKKEIVVFNRDNAELNFYDYDLEHKRSAKIARLTDLIQLDIDNDGEDEWIGSSHSTRQVYIYSHDFKDFNLISFEACDRKSILYSLKTTSSQAKLLAIQRGGDINYYSYSRNQMYSLQYAIYFGVYFLVLVLIWLIQKGQKIRLEKQMAIETQIADLQLKTIKNQVDPHFVFNAINTLSEMTLMDNKLEADRFISRFSGFMRNTLKHSDKISTSLKEELEYVENFIQLQQLRFNNAFNYEIDLDPRIDMSFKIPKHVLFTYVENAIKHSLAFIDDGVIKIHAKQKNNGLLLIVEDNGHGLSATHSGIGTGSGLKIMDRIFVLYTKRFNRKIKHQITNLSDLSDKTGLKIEIEIAA